MGAWIETSHAMEMKMMKTVAPYMGAWIETHQGMHYPRDVPCRSLHGGVD